MTEKTQQPMPKAKGMLYKAARIAKNVIDEAEIALINEYALSPLNPEDVFSFKVTMAANQVDRDHEMFPVKTLEQLSSMFVGKTVVKDHVHKSDNQIARIYQTYLQQDGTSITPAGEVYTQLIAKCYMIKTASNADLIAEINAGIRKEVSLGCQISKAVCSICDADNAKSYCKHFPGQTYDEKTCFFKLENPKDAYELSFVAIPAQREAGVVKSYGDVPVRFEERGNHEQTQQKQAEQTPQEPASAIEAKPQDEAAASLGERVTEQHAKIDEVVASVKELIAKMDGFFATIARNAKEDSEDEGASQEASADGKPADGKPADGNDTADFSDVTALAEQLDEIAARAKLQVEEDLARDTGADAPAEEPSYEGEAESKPPLSGESSPEGVSTETNRTPDGNVEEGSDVAEALSNEATASEQAERLALARLRSLDLSINVLNRH